LSSSEGCGCFTNQYKEGLPAASAYGRFLTRAIARVRIDNIFCVLLFASYSVFDVDIVVDWISDKNESTRGFALVSQFSSNSDWIKI
jgi:hypothetical protein